jgi:hypothetical protein
MYCTFNCCDIKCGDFSEIYCGDLTLSFMSILWKMAFFIEKSPLTSLNCHETMKNASILIKTWHKCWLDHYLCNNMLSLKFPLTMATRRHLKIAKNRYFALIFPSKLISKCCNFSMDWDRVKGFSALVTHYLTINLGSFLASHKSKIFLTMRGSTSPFKPPKQKGHIPLLATPWCTFLIGAAPKKWSHFLATFPKWKTVFEA